MSGKVGDGGAIKEGRPVPEELREAYAEVVEQKLPIYATLSKRFGVANSTMSRWLGDLDLKEKTFKNTIPREAVVPILERFSLEVEGMEAVGRAMEAAGLPISSRRLRAIMNGEEPMVSFNTVDRLLCAFHRTELWHEEPLQQYYWENDTPPEDLPELVNALVGLR